MSRNFLSNQFLFKIDGDQYFLNSNYNVMVWNFFQVAQIARPEFDPGHLVISHWPNEPLTSEIWTTSLYFA